MALAINSGALQQGGDETDSFILKGGLDKATSSANLQKGRCEML